MTEYNFTTVINDVTHTQGLAAVCIDHIFIKTIHEIPQRGCITSFCDLDIRGRYTTLAGLLHNMTAKSVINISRQRQYVN